jgi:hypothetical protein
MAAEDGIANKSSATSGPKSYVLKTMGYADSVTFIDEIRSELKNGCGFTPFIGAGFSVSAGIPIVKQLKRYLNRCICVALGAELDGSAGVRQLWNPRTDRWPPFIDSARPEPQDWQDLMYRRLLLERTKDDGRPQIFQEGFGAMAEWRTSLLFLSRVNLKTTRSRGGPDPYPILDLPRSEVIDACLREIMKHRKPTLNHTMLGALAGPLRLDLILSTNFDSLLEQAFESKHIHLRTFEVPLGGQLPDYSAVSQARTLIKLHGGFYSLRADYSLDAPPTELEKTTFLSYLTGQAGTSPDSNFLSTHQKRHLLVLGIGASETRSLEFLRYAWDNCPGLRIFWVCYSQEQLEKTLDFRERCLTTPKTTPSQFVVLRHTEVGLLLLQLYQAVRKTIPPSGIVFPSVTRLPVPPLENTLQQEQTKLPEDISRVEESVIGSGLSRMKEALKGRESKAFKLIVAHGQLGVTSTCYRLYRDLESDNFCLWLDLNDISSADNLFETFQEACYFKLGQEDWTPLYATKDDRPRASEIYRIARAGSKPWIIFLNAREKPGANRLSYPESNGWLDQPHNLPPFLKLVDDLCSNDTGLITVILMCRDADSPVLRELKETRAIHVEIPGHKESIPITYHPATFGSKITEWYGKADTSALREAKRQFVFTLALMQRPRFFASAWDSATYPELLKSTNGQHTVAEIRSIDRERETWLRELQELGLLRWLDGGFIWFHSERRELVRSLLRQSPQAAQEERKIHKGLAAWYRKVFASTGAAPAIFEAVDHYCFATDCALIEAAHTHDPEVIAKSMERACTYLAAARRLLRDHSFLVQTHGHPRNSIRRLDLIRDFWDAPLRGTTSGTKLDLFNYPPFNHWADNLLKSIAKLQCMCVEVSRAILREIGEDGEAYERQRELQKRIITDKPIALHEIREGIKYHKKKSGMADMVSVLSVETSERDARPHDLIRWWRWCAMLAVASRSFDRAEHSLRRALSVPCRDEAMYQGSTGDNLRLEEFNLSSLKMVHIFEKPGGTGREDQLWAFRDGDTKHKFLLELLHCIELSVYLLLLRSNTVVRRGALLWIKDERDHATLAELKAGDDRSHELLNAARCFADRGLKLADQVLTTGVYEGEHDFYANWCKSRLLMHYSLLCLPDDDTYKDYSPHAMSYLADAQAALHDSDPYRYRADLALIELHRAEVRLVEASRRRLYDQYPFERWTYDRLRESVGDAKRTCQKLWEDITRKQYDVEKVLVEVSSRSFDALRYLDLAEPMLRERRRNVWWTTWYFERRLRAMAAILWCSVVERGSPIPFLGLEAAMRMTETEADNLLTTAVRMIRVDAYRLATIILSYASCARALQVRLASDEGAVDLPERLKSMRINLVQALKELDEIERRRNAVSEQDRVDEVVQASIDDIKSLVIPVITGLLLPGRWRSS